MAGLSQVIVLDANCNRLIPEIKRIAKKTDVRKSDSSFLGVDNALSKISGNYKAHIRIESSPSGWG